MQEANAALGMNGMNVAGQNIKVEMAKIAREATPQGASNPYMALQMQQLHQYQLSALQSQSLAAQVANLRALQKSNPAAVMAPGNFILTNWSSSSPVGLPPTSIHITYVLGNWIIVKCLAFLPVHSNPQRVKACRLVQLGLSSSEDHLACRNDNLCTALSLLTASVIQCPVRRIALSAPLVKGARYHCWLVDWMC